MTYREPKEIVIRGRERWMLVPVPGTAGFWQLCHPSVLVECPKCAAGPNTPCTAFRGHIALTGHEANIAAKLANGWAVSPSAKSKLKQTLKNGKLYRAAVHREREKAYQASSHYRSGGRYGPSPFEELERADRRIVKLEAQLNRAQAQIQQLLTGLGALRETVTSAKEKL